MPDISLAESVFQNAAAATSVTVLVALVVGAIKSGLKVGPYTIEFLERAEVGTRSSESGSNKPFETTALSAYYNHALLRANISFWFSLTFATIGFGVIIFAFATHDRSDVWGTVLKAASGAIIDAVSSLFFIQSTNAQKSMSEFFEKLRVDRMNADARELISEIEDPERRDQLRAQLVIKYAAIEALVVG